MPFMGPTGATLFKKRDGTMTEDQLESLNSWNPPPVDSKSPKRYRFVGRAFRHTKKAVARGHPADRYFLVTGVGRDLDGHFLVAWKVSYRDGYYYHPAYLDDRGKSATVPPEWFSSQLPGSNSDPTAAFKPDSLYELV